MAQLAEQLICNQQVFGSSPNIGSRAMQKRIIVWPIKLAWAGQTNNPFLKCEALDWATEGCESRHASFFYKEGFPSGQRGQTVNLLRNASVVRIHHLPLLFKSVEFGVLAQLGEHLPYKQRVTGSSPVGPIFYNTTRGGAVWKLVGLITRRS